MKKSIRSVYKNCIQKGGILSIFFIVSIVFIDLASKYLAWLRSESFGIELVKNTGVAFGLFANMKFSREIFTILSIFIIFVLIYLVCLEIKEKAKDWYKIISLSLVLGGAIGNLYDRVMFGYVRDFIAFPDFWPRYNIADMAISIGVFVLVIISLKEEKW